MALVVTLCLIAVAILVLQHFASKQMLWSSAFIYQLDLRVFNARFSPQSILATLLAVGVSMWWDAMDKVLRTVQPFLSMSGSTVDVRNGAGLSYQTSYWLWASLKAAKNRHWLLSLVTLGTTLCQVRKCSMLSNSASLGRFSAELCSEDALWRLLSSYVSSMSRSSRSLIKRCTVLFATC